MSGGWVDFGVAELRAIAGGVRGGRLATRPSASTLQSYCSPLQAAWLAQQLAGFQADAATLAAFLDLLADEKARTVGAAQAVDLVWTGPEVEGMQNRDTGAVVREMFSSAQRSVLIAGYAIHQGREVFALLAKRMAELPGLRVRFVVHIPREDGDATFDADLVHRYAAEFRERNWPGEALPEVLFDPRSLELERAKRSSMHAKVIVVDESVALITSANFTAAAQTKNIEVGALVRQAAIAQQLVGHFDALFEKGWLRRVEWPVKEGR
jgi:phosphatidylserine/phosphatidylglycerophosphate/cardiolipin synthase-like enzyme